MSYAVKRTNTKTGNVSYLGSLSPFIWHHIPAFHYTMEANARKDAEAARNRINDGWGEKGAFYLIEVVPVAGR